MNIQVVHDRCRTGSSPLVEELTAGVLTAELTAGFWLQNWQQLSWLQMWQQHFACRIDSSFPGCNIGIKHLVADTAGLMLLCANCSAVLHVMPAQTVRLVCCQLQPVQEWLANQPFSLDTHLVCCQLQPEQE